MAHLPGDELVRFFCELALRYIEKDTEHDTGTDILIVASPTRGHPTHHSVEYNSEVDLVGSDDSTRRCKGGSDSV